MTESAEPRDSYLFARGERETQRLVAQARLYELPLRRLFEDAGLAAGMRVLDLGSGAGDVAFAAARAVEPTGSVVGVDVNPAVVDIARQRAREGGLVNVSFIAGDIRKDLVLDGQFDALVGRFILNHLDDPVATLRQLLEHVRRAGLVAFQEIVQQGSYAAFPSSPVWERLRGWAVATVAGSGGNVLGGLALHRIFLAAGLPPPEMRAHAAIINGPESPHLSLLVEGFRSSLPQVLELAIATAEEVDIDTLEQRIRAEFAAEQTAALGRLTVDAWTRKP